VVAEVAQVAVSEAMVEVPEALPYQEQDREEAARERVLLLHSLVVQLEALEPQEEGEDRGLPPAVLLEHQPGAAS
jgi:hypothetical protein